LTDSLAKSQNSDFSFGYGGLTGAVQTRTQTKALAQISSNKNDIRQSYISRLLQRICITNTLDMEYPVHNPNYDEFLKAYREKSKDLNYFYLQGHPNSWNENQWQNFVKIVEFLESENVKFVTPSEFLEIIKGK
jgi:hypothetical protein